MRRLILTILTATLTLSITPSHADIKITAITDGDTIKLSDGTSVRLLQIDSPELRGNECYATEAQKALAHYRDWETDRKSTRLNSSHRL